MKLRRNETISPKYSFAPTWRIKSKRRTALSSADEDDASLVYVAGSISDPSDASCSSFAS